MNNDHNDGCTCQVCERLRAKSITTQQWMEKHREHVEGREFGIEKFPHTSDTWYWIVCPCGAKHLTSDQVKSPLGPVKE